MTLLRLAQEAGDRELWDAALRDPRLGRMYRFGAGVKGSAAECMVSYGPYTYCYYDPNFDAKVRKVSLPPSRTFTRAHYGETGLLRSSWETDAVIACVSGYKGGGAHGFTNLHVQWAGHPVLRTIAAEEAQPVSCGSLPCVGGQNEIVSFLKKVECGKGFDRLFVEGIRTDQEYWLLKGDVPAVLAVARRRSRGVRRMTEGGKAFVRLDGRDSLQYERQPFFNPRAGELRMRFRLNAEIDGERPQVLFNTGIGVGRLMGTRVNTFSLGFWEKEKLTFCVHSQRNTSVSVSVPTGKVQVGKWHDVVARWGGFNRAGDQPFIEVGLDGKVERFDDQAVFGELGVDSQRLESRKEPRTFYIKSITELAFGGAVQMPNTGTACDLAEIELKCPGKKRLSVDFAQDLGPETGGGTLGWKLNPTDLKEVKAGRAVLVAGKRALEVLPVCGEGVRFEQEEVPFAPSGLAAGSLKSFITGARDDSVRVRVSTDVGEMLALVFVEKRAKAKAKAVRGEKGFELQLGKVRYGFDVKVKGKAILDLR
ncbi:MAG: hypothetical protein O2954_18765 [bacterium]|nr:hypothetical protein [bacterium]